MKKNYYLKKQKQLAESAGARRFWVFWGIYSVLLLFAFGLYLLAIKEFRIVELAFLGFVLARLVVSPAIYFFYKKARPYQKFKFEPFHSKLFSMFTDKQNAFPSDHAVSFAAVATVLFWYSPDLGVLLITFAFLNGWARIILGYHDYYDIAAGWIVGILSGLAIVYWLAPILSK